MAEEKYIQLLKKGTEVWNKERKKNPAEFIPYELGGPYLNGADFSHANLSGADLSLVFLDKTNLSYANLSSANLSRANLSGANLCCANLSYASLSGADLSGANLCSTYFNKTDLSGANLRDADLSGADLSGAILKNREFTSLKLSGANFRCADLQFSNFTETNCEEANFSSADLKGARLIDANLDNAILTGANLWETQRAGWSIKGVICEFAYFDEEGKEKIEFAPGEFERLYSDKPKVVLFYKDGISSLEFSTLPSLIKYLEESYPGGRLSIESIGNVAGGAAVTLKIDNDEDADREELKKVKAELEAKASEFIKYQKKALKEKKTRLRLEGRVEQLESNFLTLVKNWQGDNIHGDKIMGDNYTAGQGIVGKNVEAHGNTFNQIGGLIEQSMSLQELASELQQLREAMSKEAKEADDYIAIGEIAKAEEAAKANDSSKVAESLKAAGKWGLDVATKIGTSLAVEAIKQSTM